ncbi:PRC-barrel domain-containing protein [Agrobacterium sp. lyk4-40-TYG-31]|uniref:PRC-barrel domain-containing protein n=1 Tax=Agrobacterium sp. lyk4-40-TYG-31 TaxID=3040276 RepID=UPI00254F337E|nr:PRC-barrel domain-containing protein [Agrobacterium sp. lyk4-40-TYG-31]
MTLFKTAAVAVGLTFATALFATPVLAACNISDAKLEEAILQKPELRDPENRYLVLDLRTLRDAAFLLWTYGLEDDCERLVGNIKELIASPSMGGRGTSDEDAVDQQQAAGEPLQQRLGKVKGSRGTLNEGPLVPISALDPGLLVNEIVGAEVRTSDDKIVGEVRNVVIGTKDQKDYVIVASGGFFVPGKDSLVVPLLSLVIDRARTSFFLPITSAQVKSVPLMPDQDYLWLDDKEWRAKNDAIFQSLLSNIASIDKTLAPTVGTKRPSTAQ